MSCVSIYEERVSDTEMVICFTIALGDDNLFGIDLLIYIFNFQ